MGCPEPSRLLAERAEPRLPLWAASSPERPEVSSLPPLRRPQAAGGPGDCRTSAGPGAPPGRAGGNAPRRPPPPRLPPAAAALPRRGAALKGGSPPPRRTRCSGAARACRCHASARAASARAPTAAPGRRCRAGRRGRRPAGAPAARAAPLALAASARAAGRLLCTAAAAPRLHQPLGSASAGRPRRGGPRGCGARLPQLGPGEYGRPRAPQTFPAGGGHARGGASPSPRPAAPRGKAARTAGDGGGLPAVTRWVCRGTLGGKEVVTCVDGHAREPEAMGPPAVSPSIRTRKCGLGSPGRAPTPAQPRSSWRLRGRCALPTRAIISVYPVPRGLRALAPSWATLPSTGRPGLWAPVRAPRLSGAGWAR